MKAVSTIKRMNRLGARVLAPGGVSRGEAVAAAQVNLQAISDDCLRNVDRSLDLLKLSWSQADRRSDPELQREIYAHAHAIAGVAEYCGCGPLGKAAFSLCDLVDRFLANGSWSDQPVEVHLNAMVLLRSDGGAMGDAACATLLDGLRNMARRLHG